jgi:hypothetical protein
MDAESVIVRYDGPALAGHRMDIGDLAPALLGLSDLCKIANAKFNGDAAAVKVLIGADQEQKCFQFSLDIVQTFLQHAQTLLDHKDVKTAEDLFKFIGVLGSAGGAGYGLLKLLKLVKGDKAALSNPTTVHHDGRDLTQFTVNGDGNTVILAYPEAVALMNDEAAVASAKKVLAPVAKPGYQKLEFEKNHAITEAFSKAEAERVIEFEPALAEEENLGEPQTITAYVKVYAPVYDKTADSWRFMYNNAHPYIDICETDIAQKAIERGGALMNDTYRVLLEIQQTKTASGALSARYKIKKVLEFHPATLPYQQDLLELPAAKREEPPKIAEGR